MTTQLAPQGQPLSRRAKILISLAGAIVLFSMLVTAVFSFLLAPPKKIEVVTMKAGSGQAAREQLKVDCGRLPGVKVIADRGNPDPKVQGRFPVRFDIGTANARPEAALQTCINEHTDTVEGFITDGDR